MLKNLPRHFDKDALKEMLDQIGAFSGPTDHSLLVR